MVSVKPSFNFCRLQSSLSPKRESRGETTLSLCQRDPVRISVLHLNRRVLCQTYPSTENEKKRPLVSASAFAHRVAPCANSTLRCHTAENTSILHMKSSSLYHFRHLCPILVSLSTTPPHLPHELFQKDITDMSLYQLP